MKKILFTLITLFAFQFSHAQTIDSLYGNWTFNGMYTAPGKTVDSARDKSAGKMFASMAITLNNDNSAQLKFFGKDESATYKYNIKKKKITIMTETGTKFVVEILSYKNGKMAVNIANMEVWLKLE